MKLPQICEKVTANSPTWVIALALLQGCQSAVLKPDTAAKADTPVPQSASISSGKANQYTEDSSRQPEARPQPVTDNTEIKAKPANAAKTTKPVAESVARATSKTSANKPSLAVSTDVKVPDRLSKTTDKAAARKQHSATTSPTAKSIVAVNKTPNRSKKHNEVLADGSASKKNPLPGAEDGNTDNLKQANNDPLTVATSEATSTETSSAVKAQLAFAEPPARQAGDPAIAEAVTAKVPGIKLTVDKLPHIFGSWTLERNWDNQHPDTCRLRSSQTTINDGYEATYLWAEILPDEINIYTGSNIDLSYEGSGLRFGSRPVQAFTGFLTETAVNMAGDHRRLLADSSALTVYLGFWPTWPKTEVQQVDLPAQELVQALPVFEACQAWSE